MKNLINKTLQKLNLKRRSINNLKEMSASVNKPTSKSRFKVFANKPYQLEGQIQVSGKKDARGVIAIFSFYNKKGEYIPTIQQTGLSHSKTEGCFSYIDTTNPQFKIKLTTPKGATYIEIHFKVFNKSSRLCKIQNSILTLLEKKITTSSNTWIIDPSNDTATHKLETLQNLISQTSKTVALQSSLQVFTPLHQAKALKLILHLKSESNPFWELALKYFDSDKQLIVEDSSQHIFLTNADFSNKIYKNILIPPAHAHYFKIEIYASDPSDQIDLPQLDVNFIRIHSIQDIGVDDSNLLNSINPLKISRIESLEFIGNALISLSLYNKTFFQKGLSILYRRCGQTQSIKEKYDWFRDVENLPQASKKLLAHIISLTNPIESLVPPLPESLHSPNYQIDKTNLIYCLNSSIVYTPNGYGSRSHEIAKSLIKTDCNVTCLTRMGYPWERTADADLISKDAIRDTHILDGVPYEALKGPLPQELPLNHYFQISADQIFREAQKISATTIQAASNYLTGIPALIAARYAGIPFIYEVRGLWHYTEQSKLPDNISLERHDFMEKAELFLAKEADHLFVQTNQLKEWFVDHGIEADKISELPNGIDQNNFFPQPKKIELYEEYNLSPELPTIGYAGSIVSYEGLQTLIEALALIKDNAVQCFIAGSGEYLPTLKRLAKEKRVPNIHFLGSIPKDEIKDLLNLADIITIPRIGSTVTNLVAPLKPLEALALGKIVIASDLPPIKDQLKDEGFFFQSGNAQELAQLITSKLPNISPELNIQTNQPTAIPEEFKWASNAQKIKERLNHFEEKLNTIESSEPVTFAIIADLFTTRSFEGRHHMVYLKPDTWLEQFEENSITCFICESAWEGIDGQWSKKVGYYSEKEFQTLKDIIDYCNQQNIPTIFWNKEDPVHFNRFSKTATYFDHIFTTDAHSVANYLAQKSDTNKTVRSLPFFANPQLHTYSPPALNIKTCYAGTYYGERYPKRTQHLDMLLEGTHEQLTIYNRQSENKESPYQFPGKYVDCVYPSIDYETLVSKYSEFGIHINGNSVTNSPTMVSRRIFEIAACGSFIFSTPSVALSEFFSNLIPSFPNEITVKELVKTFKEHPEYLEYCSNRLTRFILSRHTLEYRMVDILRTLGISATPIHEKLPEEVKRPAKTITVAGHDLKFFKEHANALREKGYTIVTDQWNGHAAHDPNFSRFAINHTENLFCEWALGNAVFYSKFKNSNQKLTIRLHRQELVTKALNFIDYSQVERIIVVAPHMKEQLLELQPHITPEKITVIPNFVQEKGTSLDKDNQARFVLGIVGIVPQMKRLDLALDILEKLNQSGQSFTLRIKGKTPKDFTWMLNRKEEMAYYTEQYRRIRHDFQDQVIFDPHGNDMVDWYKKVGYVLSVSDFESFHLTIPDGAISGCFPIVFPWDGARELYPSDWITPDTQTAAQRILELSQLDESKLKEERQNLWPLLSDEMCRAKTIDQFIDIIG